MNSNQSDTEREFLVTGVRTYLDVWDAVLEFRTRVQEECEEAVRGRLIQINEAFKMNWTGDDLKNYVFHDPSHIEAQIGKKILFKDLGTSEGGLYFVLVLSRLNESITAEMRAFVYRDTEKIASDFWSRLSASNSQTPYLKEKFVWGIQRPLGEEIPYNFRERLTEAIDGFTACARAAGGLKA